MIRWVIDIPQPAHPQTSGRHGETVALSASQPANAASPTSSGRVRWAVATVKTTAAKVRLAAQSEATITHYIASQPT